ncbi:alcohol dehydrogenase GroES-like domain-containing protein [Apiospora rasikravindrae]|uniref:Alcohol dehydrogenase GroES-like domain-containing protein n=1 Tax=Apiospora rasikravindrae TaxID=990691 RepID=A0ABR1SI86_9PEZI
MSPSLPQTYKAAVIEKAGAPLVIKDVPLKSPGPKQVLVKVLACGVCHSDMGAQGGHFGNSFPLVPGHEIIGDVVAVGEGVNRVAIGERAGGPWHGGHDNACNTCARGLFQACDNAQINGVTRDGGYAEYVLLREEAVVRLPKSTDPAAAAPLLCAGVTVFNGLRKLHVEQGGLVAVQGIGGLGHLAIQYASKMGYRVVAISSGSSKRDFARQLGAHEYIDSSAAEPLQRLTEMGGASAIVATAPNPDAIGPLVAGLRPGGKLLVLAAAGAITVDSNTLLMKAASVVGWPSGNALDSEEAVQFAADHGVQCMVEKFALGDANEAMGHCVSGKVRFRGVLVM